MTLENTIWLFCVSSDTHSPGLDTSKRPVSGDISHCYSFGRALRFKVTGRLLPPETSCETWGFPSCGCLGRGLAEGDQDHHKGKALLPALDSPVLQGRARQQNCPAVPALHFFPCGLILPTPHGHRANTWSGVSVDVHSLTLALAITALVADMYFL